MTTKAIHADNSSHWTVSFGKVVIFSSRNKADAVECMNALGIRDSLSLKHNGRKPGTRKRRPESQRNGKPVDVTAALAS